MFENLICKIFGHKFVFCGGHKLFAHNNDSVTNKDYICLRCDIRKDKVCGVGEQQNKEEIYKNIFKIKFIYDE